MTSKWNSGRSSVPEANKVIWIILENRVPQLATFDGYGS